MTKPLKVEFTPEFFEEFEGTQEELDFVIGEITRLAKSGELFENAEPIDEEISTDPTPRTIH
jgi:hypothetical protein